MLKTWILMLGLTLAPVSAMADNVGTMLFMHVTRTDHFGSVSQVLIGHSDLGVESFYFGNRKVRIIVTTTHHGKSIVGKRYVRIDVQKGRKTVWSDDRWVSTPTHHILSLGHGYRFGIVLNPNHTVARDHSTKKRVSEKR